MTACNNALRHCYTTIYGAVLWDPSRRRIEAEEELVGTAVIQNHLPTNPHGTSSPHSKIPQKFLLHPTVMRDRSTPRIKSVRIFRDPYITLVLIGTGAYCFKVPLIKKVSGVGRVVFVHLVDRSIIFSAEACCRWV